MNARPTWLRRLTLGGGWAALLAVTACSNAVKERLPDVEAKLELARSRGAQWCAPKEFASAEAYLDFARQEVERGSVADAQTYLTYANGHVTSALDNSAGCAHDLDGDRIADMEDGDPYRAEDYDGWQDEDGVPDYDNDGDGYLDTEDACPDSPEDFDGHLDEDGCPDIDNDRDGVPDRMDRCPDEPEDVDGWQDEDGCADPDNDFDGFPDAEDKCPTAAETKNDFLDDDGCPDIRPKKFKIVMTPEIKFSGKSTRLPESEKAKLREFALRLMENPEMSVRIEAHVEPSSRPDKDQVLTQKQADAVAAVLMDAGIDPDRVIAIGFGGDRPIEGERGSANRRFLLVIFQTR
ncbi:MAG: OmpA family protein [Deltaproteobacteria bacterium]|nr:OmpA family protein [Deltaproteobacteria bacterium]